MSGTFLEGIKLYDSRKYAESLHVFLSLPADSGADGMDLAYYIGLCYTRLEQYDDALLYLEQVVTTGEDLRRAQQCRLVLAILYAQTGRMRLADFELRKLLEGGLQTAPVLSVLAYTAWEQEKTDEALGFYEQILAMYPENATALNGLGYVLACSGKDLTRALSLCKKAFDLNPESGAYMDSIGWVYYKLGLVKDAKIHIKRAKDKMPKNKIVINHFKTVHNQINENKTEEKIALGANR